MATTNGATALRIDPGEFVKAPEPYLWYHIYNGKRVVSYAGRTIVRDAVVRLRSPFCGISVTFVSVADNKVRDLSVEAFECIGVVGGVAGRKLAIEPGDSGSVSLVLRVARLGNRPFVSIAHRHMETVTDGKQVYERYVYQEHDSNDGAIIERLSETSYRLRMCEDFYGADGNRYILFDALVVDIRRVEAEEVPLSGLNSRQRRLKLRSSDWIKDDEPYILTFD